MTSTEDTLGTLVPERMCACVLVGGPDRVISVNGKLVKFEDHPQMGPCPIGKRGKPLNLGPRHPFWEAASRWYQTGKRVVDGVCFWEPEPDFREGNVFVPRVGWMPAELCARLGGEPADVYPLKPRKVVRP